MDGRLEVYDADFFSQYMHELANPSEWQAEMDRKGVQTVLQFHWWGNTRDLIQHLVNDSRWALVYYDETSVLFVRRAGNEGLISRALSAFAVEREAMERTLLEPVKSWQWPVGRIYALRVYTELLNMIGKGNDAKRFYTHLSELSPADQ
jgi:transcriptional regulator of acetoin/glycerol metabolism